MIPGSGLARTVRRALSAAPASVTKREAISAMTTIAAAKNTAITAPSAAAPAQAIAPPIQARPRKAEWPDVETPCISLFMALLESRGLAMARYSVLASPIVNRPYL